MRDMQPESEVAAWCSITAAWIAYHEKHLGDKLLPDEDETELLGALIARCHWLLASQCMWANPVRSICSSCMIPELVRQRIDGGQTPRRASFVSETRRAWDASKNV